MSRLSADGDIICWQARLTDTFSAHGMIAVVIVRVEPGQWVIDTWLQSCRVLSRGVEETLMNELVSLSRAAGTERILGEYIPTARNGMVADFYPRLGFAELDTAPMGASASSACRSPSFRSRASSTCTGRTMCVRCALEPVCHDDSKR